MYKINIIVMYGLIAGLTFGCGDVDQPSQSDGKKFIESLLASRTNGCIKLNDFKKMNATLGEVMGVKIYEMEFNASYSVVSQPCYGKYDATNKYFSEPPSGKPNPVKLLIKEAQVSLPTGMSFSVEKKKLEFVKKENGWEANPHTATIY